MQATVYHFQFNMIIERYTSAFSREEGEKFKGGRGGVRSEA
jgi:hypothetical protein